MGDPHVFHDPLLRFSLRKPEAWDFMPPAWSAVAQLKNSGNVRWEWMKWANQPFCCARKLHDSAHHAYPTLQVTVRPFPVPTDVAAKAILDSQLAFLSAQYADLEILSATSDATVAGSRANMIRARFSLFVSADAGNVTLPVLSRSIVIFSPDKAFTVGMSSSAIDEYYDEADFDEIISSICIGV